MKSHSLVIWFGCRLLGGCEEDALVVVLEHGFGVLAVDGLVVGDFLLEVEPRLLDHVPHNVV